jgi:putative acetyltransferase
MSFREIIAMFDIVPLDAGDAPAILALYRNAAAQPSHGLEREVDEIDLPYIEGFLRSAGASGLCLGLRDGDGALRGEIHASRMGPAQFAHVLADLTIVVDPACQGKGAGAILFAAFIDAVRTGFPAIESVELGVRAGHVRAIALYERLGFVVEGRFARRVRLPDGTVEDDLAMTLHLA